MTAKFVLSGRERALDHVRKAGPEGATCEEIEIALGMLHQSAAGRLNELKLQGHIKDSGITRINGTQKRAVVWILSDGVPVTPGPAVGGRKRVKKTKAAEKVATPRYFAAETESFYDTVRALASQYLQARIPSLAGSQELETQASRLAAEVDSVLREAVVRIGVLDRQTHNDSSRRTSAAWRALGMSPPKRGMETQALWKARKLKKKFTRELHPDLNSGAGAAAQLDEVIKAYTLLESVYGQAVKPESEPRKGFGS